MEEYNTDYKDICEPKTVGLILMPGQWTLHESIKICNILRGEMNVISDHINQQKLIQLINATSTCMSVSEYHNNKDLHIYY